MISKNVTFFLVFLVILIKMLEVVSLPHAYLKNGFSSIKQPQASIREGDKGLILPNTPYVKCLLHFVAMSLGVYEIVI